MPYYLAPSDITPETIDVTACTPYADRQTAYQARIDGARVLYVPDDAERDAWRERERARFADGTYTRVPWANVDRHADHFVHLSLDSPGKVAYTVDDENGYANRKRCVTPGRYLDEYYQHVTRDVRLIWASACVAPSFSVATDAEQIVSIYRSPDIGSCMDSRHGARLHPSRVYAGSDLSVAYLGPVSHALARCVIWPAKLRHTTVYGSGTAPDLLRHALAAQGYTRGSFDGAKIRRIMHPDGGYVMPYVDGSDCAEDLGDGWILLGSGEIGVKYQTGRSDEYGTCDNCNEQCEHDESYCQSCRDARYECEHCGDEDCFDEDLAPYCYSCNETRVHCELCSEDTWSETFTVLGRYGYRMEICEDCADNSHRYAFACVHCDSSESEARYDLSVQRERRDNGLAQVLCVDCDDSGIVVCADCDSTHDESDDLCADCAAETHAWIVSTHRADC